MLLAPAGMGMLLAPAGMADTPAVTPEGAALKVPVIPGEDLQIGESLGEGGQGEVFRGRWLSRECDVAVKRFNVDSSGVPKGTWEGVLDRGMKEMQRMAEAAMHSNRVCP